MYLSLKLKGVSYRGNITQQNFIDNEVTLKVILGLDETWDRVQIHGICPGLYLRLSFLNMEHSKNKRGGFINWEKSYG